jgi:TPR repeat protein
MKNVHADFRRAVQLLERGQADQALRLADSLTSSMDERHRLDGYMCRGMIFEEGGSDLCVDLDKALDSYRRASLIAPNSITFTSLARVSLKRRAYAESLRFLQIAADHELTPEVLLGFAQYSEESVPMDASKAKSYYLRAALKGRFSGFFGYSRMSRKMGQPVRAALVDALRIIAGPLIALAIGARARYQF